MTVRRLTGWNRFADKQTASPWAERGKSNEQQESPIPPAIEDIAGNKDEGILDIQCRLFAYVPIMEERVTRSVCAGGRQKPIEKKHYRQKEGKF